MKRFKPDYISESVYELDLTEFEQNGITTLVFDLDATLASEEAEYPDERLKSWIENLEKLGFKRAIVSNNTKERVKKFADDIKVHAIYEAEKPSTVKLKKTIRLLRSEPEECVMIGDRLLTDVFVGKKLGMKTALVKPIGSDIKLSVKILRKIEIIVLKILLKKKSKKED